MHFADMSWMDVENYLKADDRLVVIIGACEQHGYVSLLADVLAPVKIAEAACSIEKVLIAPPLPYGVSPYFITYPGTISLRVETFATVVREVLDGLIRQGFRRILVSNGHGGNTGVLTALLVELGNQHPDARLELFQWWTHPDVVKASDEIGLAQRHANWSENFPFTRVGPSPSHIKPMVQGSRTANAQQTRELLGDGSYGGVYQASDEAMDLLLVAASDAMVAALRALAAG